MAQIKIKSSFVAKACKGLLERLRPGTTYLDLKERAKEILWLCSLSEEITLDISDYEVLRDDLFIYNGEQFGNEAQMIAFIANQEKENEANGC